MQLVPPTIPPITAKYDDLLWRTFPTETKCVERWEQSRLWANNRCCRHSWDKHKVSSGGEDGAAFNCCIWAVFVRGSNCTFLVLAPRARLQSSSVVGKKGPDAINNRQPQQSQLYSCQRHNWTFSSVENRKYAESLIKQYCLVVSLWQLLSLYAGVSVTHSYQAFSNQCKVWVEDEAKHGSRMTITLLGRERSGSRM